MVFVRATHSNNDVWTNMSRNWSHFFWLTGEFPRTLNSIVIKMKNTYYINRAMGRRTLLTVRNQVRSTSAYKHKYCCEYFNYFIFLFFAIMYLFPFQILLTFIWLRNYPTMATLSMIFGISTPSVHNVIHRMIPRLHALLVPKYIRWHSMAHWRRLSGYFPEWPNVVGIMDCTPFRIRRPTGFTISNAYLNNNIH